MHCLLPDFFESSIPRSFGYQTVTKPLIGECTKQAIRSDIDHRHNAYRVNLNVSNCGVANGAYEGLAGLLSTFSANDTLEFALSDQSLAEVNGITRF